MSKAVILDSSALIALISKENGSTVVEQHLTNAEISSVNLTEVLTYVITKQRIAEEAAIGLVRDLSIPTVDFDELQAFIAANLILKPNIKAYP